MFNLIQLELLKTKRSLSLLMMVLTPATVVLVNVLLLLNNGGAMVEERGWSLFWMANFSMWGYFMLPLYIALITALLNGIEHNSSGWRLMLSLPISQWHFFLVKLFVAWLYVVGASVVLFIQISLAIILFDMFGIAGGTWWNFTLTGTMTYTLIACLAILIIQHMVSWRWANIVIPLTLGVTATMSIMQASGSKYWVWDPWAYILMATNGSEGEYRLMAITLSALVFCCCLVISKFWLGSREIAC